MFVVQDACPAIHDVSAAAAAAADDDDDDNGLMITVDNADLRVEPRRYDRQAATADISPAVSQLALGAADLAGVITCQQQQQQQQQQQVDVSDDVDDVDDCHDTSQRQSVASHEQIAVTSTSNSSHDVVEQRVSDDDDDDCEEDDRLECRDVAQLSDDDDDDDDDDDKRLDSHDVSQCHNAYHDYVVVSLTSNSSHVDVPSDFGADPERLSKSSACPDDVRMTDAGLEVKDVERVSKSSACPDDVGVTCDAGVEVKVTSYSDNDDGDDDDDDDDDDSRDSTDAGKCGAHTHISQLAVESQTAKETETFLRQTLWRLAMKQLRRDDWKKLAKHWQFTDEQIEAILWQYTGLSVSLSVCLPVRPSVSLRVLKTL